MLVLSRRKGERILIDDEITLTIVEIRGDKVRIGIEAPQGVAVHREEVWQAIQAETPIEPLPGVAVPKSLGDMVRDKVTRGPCAGPVIRNRALRTPDDGEDQA